MSDQNNILTTEETPATPATPTADVLAGQDYYRNLVNVKEKGPMYDQMRNQNIAQVIDAGRNIAKNEVNALQQYESSKYQAAQTIDKSGWSGGYALDTNKQLSYMRESIQADILSQKELQKLGYKSALGQAIAATELQADQLALDRYRQARQDAEYTSQLTGYYVEPHIADMATQVSALSTLIEGEQEGSPNKIKYETTLKALQSKLSEIVRTKNQELKAQGADYSFGNLDEQGNFISVTGIKTLAQIQREAQLRTEELQQALLTEDIEVKRADAAIKKADMYEKLDSEGNVMRDAEGNVIYGSHSADRQAEMDELSIRDAEIGIEIKENQLRTDSYDPTTGSVIPVFNEDGTIKSYTNAVPTTKEEFEELKKHFADNPPEFNKFFNNTLSQLKSGMSEGDDFGTYFANTFSNTNLKAIIDKYEPEGDSFSMGGVTFKKVEQDDQKVIVNEEEFTLPKDSWVVIDEATGSGYCYNNTPDGQNFAFTKVTEPGGEDDVATGGGSATEKNSYNTSATSHDEKAKNLDKALENAWNGVGKDVKYVTIKWENNIPIYEMTGDTSALIVPYSTDGGKTWDNKIEAIFADRVAIPENDWKKTDGKEIKAGEIVKVGSDYWLKTNRAYRKLNNASLTDSEKNALNNMASSAINSKKDIGVSNADGLTGADGTTYKVTSKEKGYEVSDDKFNNANVNNITVTVGDKWYDIPITDKKKVTHTHEPGTLFQKDSAYYIAGKDHNSAYGLKTGGSEDWNKLLPKLVKPAQP